MYGHVTNLLNSIVTFFEMDVLNGYFLNFMSPANVSVNNFCCYSNFFYTRVLSAEGCLSKTVQHISISTTITTFIIVVYINRPYLEFGMFSCELIIFWIFSHFIFASGIFPRDSRCWRIARKREITNKWKNAKNRIRSRPVKLGGIAAQKGLRSNVVFYDLLNFLQQR